MSLHRYEEKFSLLERDAIYLEEYVRRYMAEKEAASQRVWFRSDAIGQLIVTGIRVERAQVFCETVVERSGGVTQSSGPVTPSKTRIDGGSERSWLETSAAEAQSRTGGPPKAEKLS